MKKIRIERIDNHIESLMLTGMIVSSRFLKSLQDIYHPDFVEASFVKIVARWCIHYYKQYKKAPKVHIQDIFNSHKRNGLDPNQAEMIEDYLESISNEYSRAKKFNVEYLLTQCEKLFKERSLYNYAEDIKNLLSKGQTKEAEALQDEYKRVSRPITSGVDVLTDRNAIYDAIEGRKKNIVYTPPGDLGRFTGPFVRESFTAIEAMEKKGKTWWLMQLGAIWPLQAGCNVAFFECGDMSQEDIMERMLCNIAKLTNRNQDVGRRLVPVLDCAHNQDNTCVFKKRVCNFGVMRGEEKITFAEAKGYIPCIVCRKDMENAHRFRGAHWLKWETIEKMDWRKAEETAKKFKARFKNCGLKLSTHPTRTINVKGIETQLDIWERAQKFIPDVIVIDYADILAKEDNQIADARTVENDRWSALRRLSQERKVALFVGTQADTDSYTRATLRETNFSEDKRKNAHITMKLTLNQLPEEKEAGVMRIGRLFVRNGRNDSRATCTVLQCLEVGRPYLASYCRYNRA